MQAIHTDLVTASYTVWAIRRAVKRAAAVNSSSSVAHVNFVDIDRGHRKCCEDWLVRIGKILRLCQQGQLLGLQSRCEKAANATAPRLRRTRPPSDGQGSPNSHLPTPRSIAGLIKAARVGVVSCLHRDPLFRTFDGKSALLELSPTTTMLLQCGYGLIPDLSALLHRWSEGRQLMSGSLSI